jgi:hypothetical protein
LTHIRHSATALQILALALLCWLARAGAHAQLCLQPACASWFPADSGAINARDFGARGDGKTDDTGAIIAALAASGGDYGHQVWLDRIVFLPAGTYVVSNTLLKRYQNGNFASGSILIGESPERTIIRLADNARGFSDRNNPKPVIMTTSKLLDSPAGRDYYGKGEGNDAYENFVENLTIDVGRGNPGAIGIDYLANNIGAIRNVIVEAPDGSGATGISMLRKWPGPTLLQQVFVQGFDVGIDVANTEYGVTLSQIRLAGQRVAGLRNTDNMVTAEDLSISTPSGTAIINRTALGMVALIGGAIDLTAATAQAIDNRGAIVFSGTHMPQVAESPILRAANGLSSGWLGGTEWHADIPAYALPHTLAPVPETDPASTWTGVTGTDPSAPPVDATAALQAAFNKGGTVYLRHGIFWLSAPLVVPPQLHRIIGMTSTLHVLPAARGYFPRDQGMLRILQPGGVFTLEHIALDNTDLGSQSGVEIDAARTVVLRDVLSAGVTTIDRRSNGGATYMEDTCCGPALVAGPAQVTARQLNTEGGGVRIQNRGARLLIIGLKTEGNCTVVSSTSGARTVVLGGLLYIVSNPSPAALPAFVSDNSTFMGAFVEESVRSSSHYTDYLLERGGSGSRAVAAATMPSRGLGRLVPLLQSDPLYAH